MPKCYTCEKCYLIPALNEDGIEVRPMKYTKQFSKVISRWLDYRSRVVVDNTEISRLDQYTNGDNEVFCSYDDFAEFNMDANIVTTSSNLPVDKKHIIINLTQSQGEGFINFSKGKVLDGDEYYILIRNLTNNNIIEIAPADSNDINIISVAVKLSPGEATKVRATYNKGIWYYEIPCSCKSEENVVDVGNDLDFLVFRYMWDSGAGTGFDTATEITGTGITELDDQAVGWNVSDRASEEVKKLLVWAGDNQQSGEECVYIDLNKLVQDYQGRLPEIVYFNIYGAWYNQIGTGDASFSLLGFKGGEMEKEGFNFVNNGGEQEYANLHNFNCPVFTNKNSNQQAQNYKTEYKRIAYVTYNTVTQNTKITIVT